MNQCSCRAVRQNGKSLQILAEIMRVWIDREQIYIDRKREFVRDQETLFTGWDVQLPVVFQLEQQREKGRGSIGEVETKTWLNLLRLARRL